ncbi:MAG TPA: RdgB/HAM1 family non-canonical purine NTP pyrophosphatase [Woeseiaceae bacterium]|nr:RdgB/HAM1 family non-canonical purine NTP pyrophosphatase [Woeseiaceae bacterium]
MARTEQKVVIASGNAGKLRELRRLLEPLGLLLVPQAELGIEAAAETAATFVDNALIKARHAARGARLPALADDSGLAVDALDGRPGVRSARYAGRQATDADNVARLLAELDGVPGAARSAAFHCAAVFVRHAEDPAPLIAHGHWPGRILEARDGDGGFGYDPVFFDPAAGCSAARMSAAQKNARSHRGQAFRALLPQLAAVFPA